MMANLRVAIAVTAIASVVITRYRPDAGSHPQVGDATMQGDGERP